MTNKKVLFVLRPESLHNARWLRQAAMPGVEFHVFPSFPWAVPHPKFPPVLLHQFGFPSTTHLAGSPVPKLSEWVRRLTYAIWPSFHRLFLRRTLKNLKPDLIHVIEVQNGGYMVGNLLESVISPPPLLVTCWGSDLFYYGQSPDHLSRIKKVLKHTTTFHAECRRDQKLAREYGFTGSFGPLIQATGAMDLGKIQEFRAIAAPPDKRHKILIKGCHGFIGRGMVALEALQKAGPVVSGYEALVISAPPEVARWVHMNSQACSCPIRLVPPTTSHEEILRLFSESRVFIGLSLSDGVPNTMLEAMALGAFPIQSNTSAADEWLVDEQTGFLVPPEDSSLTATRLRQALANNPLCSSAGARNWETIQKRMNSTIIHQAIRNMYQDLLG